MFPPRLKPTTTSSVSGKVRLMQLTMAANSQVQPEWKTDSLNHPPTFCERTAYTSVCNERMNIRLIRQHLKAAPQTACPRDGGGVATIKIQAAIGREQRCTCSCSTPAAWELRAAQTSQPVGSNNVQSAAVLQPSGRPLK
ncbi:hypothetical protein INR49_017596 [Caranx melampygus]|nr:hypothetical protein INR49_017596 [Caranx melampygus]